MGYACAAHVAVYGEAQASLAPRGDRGVCLSVAFP